MELDTQINFELYADGFRAGVEAVVQYLTSRIESGKITHELAEELLAELQILQAAEVEVREQSSDET